MIEYDYLDVTEDGRVFRCRCYEVKPDINPAGYARVRDGKGNRHLVHQLVARKYIPNPLKKREVHHKDKNTLNNNVENLQWLSRQEHAEEDFALHWDFIDPHGNFITVYNLTKFCRDNKLNQGHMWSVHKGRVKSCKGWRKA